jgi:CRISPR-associated protein Cmr6
MTYSNGGNVNSRRTASNPALARGVAVGRSEVPQRPNQAIRSSRDDFDAVPIEYRAQIKYRAQRQFVQVKPKGSPESWRSDIQRWHDEWMMAIRKALPASDHFDGNENSLVYQCEIDWRLIANSGTDEGFIRPVVNSRGWPLIPGSSIKGIFRREWLRQRLPPDELEGLCGPSPETKPLRQGALRFHGAFIRNLNCIEKSLDLTHPQQSWQLGFYRDQSKCERNAFGLISLWRPELSIVISCRPGSVSKAKWLQINKVLEASLGAGIGGRTSAGYGRISDTTIFKEAFTCKLRGQGIAPKLLDVKGTAEFRPVSFRASIRCMAMRLFAGLIPQVQATRQVERLFGSLNGPTVGLLGCHFQEDYPPKIGLPAPPANPNGNNRWQFTPPMVMDVQGTLIWEFMQPCAYKEELQDLLAALHGLVMGLGGFSKGWRRVDHRLFPLHKDGEFYAKTPIGCQWHWLQIPANMDWINIQKIAHLSPLLDLCRKHARRWLSTQGVTDVALGGQCPTRWREVIHPAKMKIWARHAEANDDCRAIDWFHLGPIQSGLPGVRDCQFKHPSLIGQSRAPSRVGHVWHRMLPVGDPRSYGYVPLVDDVFYDGKIVPEVWDGPFLEILTFFTGIDNQAIESDFLALMNTAKGGKDAQFKPINFP